MGGFNPKDWEDYPSTATPRSAAALIDQEQRLAAYADALQRWGGTEEGAYEPLPRAAGGYLTHFLLSNGYIEGICFQAQYDYLAGAVTTVTGSPGATGGTVRRVGLWTLNAATGALMALVASTANDLTLWDNQDAEYTRDFTTPYQMVGGSWYFCAPLIVGASVLPKLVYFRDDSVAHARRPFIGSYNFAGGATDLPASVAAATMVANNTSPYIKFEE